MQAILLVGGFGTRLHPLTLTTPKQMLPVLHRPMIEHVVSGLARHGVERVVLALGYRDDVFRVAYPDGRCAGVELRCVVEPEPLDTAGAIRFAYEESGMDAADGTFLVANGDVITDLDVSRMADMHRSSGAEATVHLTAVDDPSRYGVVVAAPDGRVREFVEKPASSAPAPSRWINAGTYLMEPSVIERITAGRRVSVEREMFPAMAAAGALWSFRDAAYWVDAGTPQTYLQAQMDLLDGRRGPAADGVSPQTAVGVSPQAAVGVSGPQADVGVSPQAAVGVSPQAEPDPKGRSSIGVSPQAAVGVSPQAVVDPNAVVERSVVMAGAVVGAGATVRGSAVLSDAVVAPGAVVLDSVVGFGARIGRGARITDGSLIGEGFRVAPGSALSGARAPDAA